MAAEGDDGRIRRTLYVGGLAEEVSKEILSAAFIPFGELRNVEMPIDNSTGSHRGFGFVEFEDEDDAKNAIENMNNSELFGRVLRVNTSRSLGRSQPSSNKPVWADDFFYRQKLLKEGIGVEGGETDLAPSSIDAETSAPGKSRGS